MTIDRDMGTAELAAPPSRPPRRWDGSVPRIVLGLLFVAIGLLITLDTLGVVRIDYAGGLWPLALIGVGAAKLWEGWSTAEAGAGVWLVLAGAWFLAVRFHVVGLTLQNSWPLLLVATGIAMTWRALLEPVSGTTSLGSSRRPSPDRASLAHRDRRRGHSPVPVRRQGRDPVIGGSMEVR